MKLGGKVAIVTGAGRGIGRAIAEALASEGARIVVAEAAEKRAKEAAVEINKAGGQAIEMILDVGKKDEIRKTVKTVLEQFGKIDILVNNAGIMELNKFLEGQEERWDKMISVNLRGVIMFTRAVLDSMLEREYGKIINIASIVGLTGMELQVVYSATKGGVIAFTKALAEEIGRYHVNVNAICPGIIDTVMVAKGVELLPDYFEKKLKNIPLGRLGRPEDVARAAVFLASDDSEYITGQCLTVDGGICRA